MKSFHVIVDGTMAREFATSFEALAYAGELKDQRGEDSDDDSVRVRMVLQ